MCKKYIKIKHILKNVFIHHDSITGFYSCWGYADQSFLNVIELTE